MIFFKLVYLQEIEQQFENVENAVVKAPRESLIANQHPLRRFVGVLITLLVVLIFWIY